jgi:hypothetical protein
MPLAQPDNTHPQTLTTFLDILENQKYVDMQQNHTVPAAYSEALLRT